MPHEDSECVDSLRRLQKLGVTVSIDDFGTGYSSLGRLQGLPVDKLKIDKCFMKGLGCSRDAELIVRAIIALGRSLGLMVVAEGVQNQDQIDFLKAEGCHGIQGFYLAPPLPSADVTRMLTCGFVRWSGGDGSPKIETAHRPYALVAP
jgi:EAL domain-containing protein (putative c-di-GMP-specific phosphodiesterase class I)